MPSVTSSLTRDPHNASTIERPARTTIVDVEFEPVAVGARKEPVRWAAVAPAPAPAEVVRREAPPARPARGPKAVLDLVAEGIIV